jgi:hypothetical protein
MSDQNSPLMPHGGYEKLRAYKVAEVVYDGDPSDQCGAGQPFR